MQSRPSAIRRAKPLLGTLVEIACHAPDGATALNASEQAFKAVAQVHQLMSRHDSTSELSALNRLSPDAWLTVSAETLEVLTFAQTLSQRTAGVFDVFSTSPLASNGSNWRDLELDAPNQRLRKHAPLHADLGGIAKGYAVDQAVLALKKAGAECGWVNAGGDLRVFGAQSMPLQVRAPWDAGLLLPCGTLHEQAAASSASYWLSKPALLHGLTLKPAKVDASYTVVAHECIAADALTKVVAAFNTQRSMACPALRDLLALYEAIAFSHQAPGAGATTTKQANPAALTLAYG